MATIFTYWAIATIDASRRVMDTLSADGRTIYSYNVPILSQIGDSNRVLVLQDGCSVTTARHRNEALERLTTMIGDRQWVIILATERELRCVAGMGHDETDDNVQAVIIRHDHTPMKPDKGKVRVLMNHWYYRLDKLDQMIRNAA